MYFFHVGGKVNLGSNAEQITANYPAWAKSVQDGYTSFINCTSGIMIWDLIAFVDEDKATSVKNSYYGIQDEVKTEITDEFGEETNGEDPINEVDNAGTL